jgi:ribosome-binding factor A
LKLSGNWIDMSVRLKKMSALVKEELSLIFLHKINDPSLGFLTITNVKLTPDLKIAKVYLSIYEREKREEVMEKINNLSGFIRSQLAIKLKNIKQIPELSFYVDDTLDYVEKMENIFKEIHKDDNKRVE